MATSATPQEEPDGEFREESPDVTGTFNRTEMDGMVAVPDHAADNEQDPDDVETWLLEGSSLKGDPERWVRLGKRGPLKKAQSDG